MVSTNYTDNMNVSSANSCSLPMAHGIPLILVNAIVCVLGSLGNLLVCLAIATNSRLRRASNYLLFSLAIADLIITIVCEPIVLEYISFLTFFHECRRRPQLRVYSILSVLSCQASVLHLAAISLDRFVAVAFPLRHKIFMDKGGLKIMLIASWSLPILSSGLPNIIPTVSTPVFSFIRIGIFALSGLSIFFFHFLIVVALLYYRKKTKQLRARTVSVRVTCTLAIATGVFIVCWAPIITVLAVDKWRRSPLHFWLQTLALSNSAMNFVIYSARMRDFKDAYVGILRKMLCL